MSSAAKTQYQDAIKFQLKTLNIASDDTLCDKFLPLLPQEYINCYTPEDIAKDIIALDTLSLDNHYAFNISKSLESDSSVWQIKLFKYNSSVSLSTVLPIIENFGLKLIDEHLRKIKFSDGTIIYLCDFGVQIDGELWGQSFNNEHIKQNLIQASLDVCNGIIESDSLNKLALRCGMDSRSITLLRGIAHYVVQGALPFSKEHIKDCLSEYPDIASNLFAFFEAKFNSSISNFKNPTKITETIVSNLLNVVNINDDRILRACFNVIDAMLRTNYYQMDNNGNHKQYISFKIESVKLNFLPKPKPLYEIFVYSKRMEGVHLRGGKIARGGMRWSDRKEDFRTEVLGLVKAQIVKNSVIVPTGSKGGFICKMLPIVTDIDAYQKEGVYCYTTFIEGLLDLTDNLIKGQVIPPNQVVCYDEADPYLVVAADKGTARFSDYANAISLKRQFWLGDAFASGGSAGYDHKKIGITAKGVWESVKRHFRHLDRDITREDFTVVGIGDMEGDVFGNGMLLSKHIKLIAVFNHQHIFLDPNPDSNTSYEERLRLFNLPRSSWLDYDKSKISAGGGIYERHQKSIAITKEVAKALDINATTLTPNEIIKMILTANVDMLYNGGIGTYVKSSIESNEMVKDKANDSLRIDGKDLRVKIVAEGGNLGVTQLGRIEFAKKGGFIYTDAIDNSAGVDCSDHEVNIKILFADVMAHANMDLNTRNKILEQMTDNVSQLVLHDNYLQTQILRYADQRSIELLTADMNFIDKLERRGELDRRVEFLPDVKEFMDRQKDGIGLTMPELSVLLAYSKIDLNKKILSANILDGNLFDELLFDYFPKLLQKDYHPFIKNHYLKKHIIANQLSNLIVNLMGITFISRFEDELRVDATEIIRAFWSAYQLLDIKTILNQIESFDNIINADVQIYMFIRVKKSLERLTRWILRNVKSDIISTEIVTLHKSAMGILLSNVPDILLGEDYPDIQEVDESLIKAHVPDTFAKLISRSNIYPQLLDIATIHYDTSHDLLSVAHNYFYTGRVLRFDWLRKNLILLPENNKWQALSRSALLVDGYKLYSTLIRKALQNPSANIDKNFMSTWIQSNTHIVSQINTMFDELQSYKVLDLAMLSAVVRELSLMFIA